MAIKSQENKKIMVVIISVLIAFVLWIYVMSEKNPIQTKIITGVPVALTNVEAVTQSNLALMPGQSFTIDLSVTGRANDIFPMTALDVKVEADMGGYIKKGVNNIPIKISPLRKGISVSKKTGPPYITVTLDGLAQKTIPVVFNIRGNVKEGYSYMKPLIRPTEVIVSGPETFVKKVFAAMGQTDISGNYANISGAYNIVPQDKNGTVVHNVNLDPKYVDATVSIKPSKEVPIKINTTGVINDGKILRSIKPQLDKISIIGDKKIINAINQINTSNLDLSKLSSSSTIELPLNIPAGVNVAGDIKSINVDIVVENKIEKNIELPISIINQSSDYVYSVSDEKVAVTMVGPESIMNYLNSKNITAVADVGGFTEGTNNIPITISQVEGVEMQTYSPDTITVVIGKK